MSNNNRTTPALRNATPDQIDHRRCWPKKLTDAALERLSDLRPVTQRTARRRVQRAGQLWFEAGLQEAATAVQEELNASMSKRLRGAR